MRQPQNCELEQEVAGGGGRALAELRHSPAVLDWRTATTQGHEMNFDPQAATAVYIDSLGADALASALVKTAEYRDPRPHPLQETLFYTHPSVERRVRSAMEWKAAHSP